MPERATLRVQGHGGVEVELVAKFLEALRRAYASLFVFDGLFDRPHHMFKIIMFPQSSLIGRTLNTEELETFIPFSERLILAQVTLSSPGDWKFLGALNPLEVIRKSLNDHHERRKHREYREGAERERLELENELLRLKIVAEKVRLAKEELGATDRELVPLLNQLVYEPLRALGRYQTEGLIEDAELTPQQDDH
jgi:hypothetical protein